jgi:hypothetical protein
LQEKSLTLQPLDLDAGREAAWRDPVAAAGGDARRLV